MENGVSNGGFILTDDGILRESCVARVSNEAGKFLGLKMSVVLREN